MFVWGYAKVLLASLVTGAAVMLAVSAWQLRHGGDRDVFTRSARLALMVLVPAILFTMLVGDELGVIEAKYQPMKIAAAEAQWTTCQPCSFSLFQIGGGNNDQNPLQAQYSKQYGPVPCGPCLPYLNVGALAHTSQETRDPGVLVGGGMGCGAAVPDEHRGLVPDRERPAAVDRAGDHADQERISPTVSTTWLWISLVGFILLYGTLGTVDLLLMLRYSQRAPARAHRGRHGPADRLLHP